MSNHRLNIGIAAWGLTIGTEQSSDNVVTLLLLLCFEILSIVLMASESGFEFRQHIVARKGASRRKSVREIKEKASSEVRAQDGEKSVAHRGHQ